MNRKKICAIILAFSIGSTLFLSKDYLLATTNSVYAATINENLSPITDIDSPKNNSNNSNSISISGWALNKSGIKQVQILVDGQFKGNANINQVRLDVENTFPAYGQANSGYSYTIDFNSIGAGPHNLTVQAIGNDGSSNSNTIKINVNKPAPLICVDTPHSGDSTLNQTTIAGWSLNASKVSSVDILVDGTKVGNAALGIARPDVANFLPAYNDGTSGFTYTLDTSNLSHKAHTITVKSNGNDGSSATQSFTLNRPANITTIDTPKMEQAVKDNNVNIAGWALNPSGVKQIDIIMNGLTVGQAILGDSRPDVANFYPQYNDVKSGYHFNLDTSHLSGGDYTITLKVTGNDGTTSINETSIYVDKPKAIMCVDTLSSTQNVLNSVPVNGWALNFSGLQQVEIFLDNTKVGNAALGIARPDVANFYPKYNDANSGFSYNLDTSKLKQGYHLVTVKVTGKDGTTSSQNYIISRPQAMTDIDSPQNGLLLKGTNTNTINVVGWALNPSGVKQVNILVDGTQVGTTNTNGSRLDVAKFYPQYNDANSGYSYPLNTSTIGGGNHTITVQAIGNDGSIQANNVSITRPNSLLTIDSPEQNQSFDASKQTNVNIGGWALDITGIKQVSIAVDTQSAQNATIGVPRQDVYNFYPDYNNKNAGYNYTLDLTKLETGNHTITITSTGNSGQTVSTTRTIKVNNPSLIPVTSVNLNKSIENLTVGDTDTLTATTVPTNATNKDVTWTSSNSAVATVDATGKITAVAAGTATITATTVDGSKTANCTITVNNKKGYVNNAYLNVRSAPSLNANNIVGVLYDYQSIDILDSVTDSADNITWDKIIYNNTTAYVSDAYIQHYTSPPNNVVNIASNITKQFEVGTFDQIVGNFDGEGLSLGYFQWCIGQGTLQPLLNRMDSQYNSEMKSIFGTNYDAIHNMLQDTQVNQLNWAKSINNSSNNISAPWYSQLVSLTNNQHFIGIENDAQVYTVHQAMLICDKYKLNTVRGFALAFDIVNQNGSISPAAQETIATAFITNPNMSEKDLLTVIANAVANSSTTNSSDILPRKMAIINGEGTVHGIDLNLNSNFGLNDNLWR